MNDFWSLCFSLDPIQLVKVRWSPYLERFDGSSGVDSRDNFSSPPSFFRWFSYLGFTKSTPANIGLQQHFRLFFPFPISFAKSKDLEKCRNLGRVERLFPLQRRCSTTLLLEVLRTYFPALLIMMILIRERLLDLRLIYSNLQTTR